MKRTIRLLCIATTLLGFSSCEKFLAERNTNLVSNIYSLKDMQALMDAGNRINRSYCGLVDMATDDFFVGANGFQNAADIEKAMYTWDGHYIYDIGYMATYWRNPFHIIAIANTVLDELPLVQETAGLHPDHIEGTALFHRAFTYHNLVQVYCKAYDAGTAMNDLGLPLRLDSDVNRPSRRASLEDTFKVIEQDIKKSIELLPVYSAYKTRPNKAAAHALLARVYLLMERYPEALLQANLSLSLYDTMMDFNTMNPSLTYPIEPLNQETIFYAVGGGAVFISQSSYRESYVDTALYDSYHPNDLRKRMFFQAEGNGYVTFKGGYSGGVAGDSFIGLTVSELLLIKAETLVRTGAVSEAIEALNSLLIHRYETSAFQPVSGLEAEELLALILQERRKELIFRGTRWSDLKRLNRDPRFAKTLYRKVPGSDRMYELPPNDPRYVYLVPQEAIEKTGMEQNPR